MSFAKHPRTLAISRSNNAVRMRLSICCAGIFIWIFLYSVSIAEQPGDSPRVLRSGNTARVKVVVEAKGELQLTAESEAQPSPKKLPMKAIGNLTYDEVAVSATKSNDRVARYYHEAKAQLSVSERPSESRLRADRRYILCDSTDDAAELYSTTGALTRDELELITVPGNSAMIDQLLPSAIASIEVSQEWTHDDDLLAKLLNLHAVTANDVKSKAVAIEDNLIRMEIAGNIVGSVDGVLTDIEINGKYNFDRQKKCITWFATTIKEDRAVGPTTPGFQVEARVRVAIDPDADSSFAAQTVQTAPGGPAAGMQLLEFEPKDSTFALTHDRRWHVLSQQPKYAVLRFVEDGQTIAQCNLREIPVAGKAKPVTLDSFKMDAVKGLAKSQPQIVSANESTNPAGMKVFRVQIAGTVSNAAVQWIYHLAIDKKGRGVSYVFTMAADLAEQFGAADMEITSTLKFSETDDTEVRMVELRTENGVSR